MKRPRTHNIRKVKSKIILLNLLHRCAPLIREALQIKYGTAKSIADVFPLGGYTGDGYGNVGNTHEREFNLDKP